MLSPSGKAKDFPCTLTVRRQYLTSKWNSSWSFWLRMNWRRGAGSCWMAESMTSVPRSCRPGLPCLSTLTKQGLYLKQPQVDKLPQQVCPVGRGAYLGRGGPELLEEVREEGRVMLQLGQDLHIVEQHHALQGSKCLVVENLNRTHNFTQTEIVDQARQLQPRGPIAIFLQPEEGRLPSMLVDTCWSNSSTMPGRFKKPFSPPAEYADSILMSFTQWRSC
ncbi:MAG: hypothetical protein FRX49_11227 [Trebouxia sp. A1-2]|nr:MAG: hypothetical protein FRX49_11227 [Trebouxia sp. A1-2]